MLCQKVGGCIQRCMGIDGSNAIYNVSYEADKPNNGATQYHENFKKWLTRFQKEDLDRLLRPDRREGRPDDAAGRTAGPRRLMSTSRSARTTASSSSGCKVHISEASVADEILVVPTRALRAEDKDYAVAFAVPGRLGRREAGRHDPQPQGAGAFTSAASCRAPPIPT